MNWAEIQFVTVDEHSTLEIQSQLLQKLMLLEICIKKKNKDISEQTLLLLTRGGFPHVIL